MNLSQINYKGERTARLQMFDYFNDAGHCDFPTSDLMQLFGCGETTAQRYRREWEGLRRDARRQEDAPKHAGHCKHCSFTGWDKNPILGNGMCLWCNCQLEGVNLSRLVETYEWEEILSVVKLEKRYGWQAVLHLLRG